MSKTPMTARQLILQVRIYRSLASLFVFFGLVIFIMMYMHNIDGRVFEALTEFHTVLIIVFPFLPAVFLSLMAKSAEKKYLSFKTTDQATKG